MIAVKRLLLCAAALAVVLATELSMASLICSGSCQTVKEGEGPLWLAATAPLTTFSAETVYNPNGTDGAYCRHMQRAASLYPYQVACRNVRTTQASSVNGKKKYKTTKPVFWYTQELKNYFKIDADDKKTLRFTKKKQFTYAVTCYRGWTESAADILFDLWDETVIQFTESRPVMCVFTFVDVPVTPACETDGGRLWLDATVSATAHMHLFMRPGGDTKYDKEGDAKVGAAMPEYNCPAFDTLRQNYRELFQFKTVV